MSQVFISYSHKNVEFVKRLAQGLGASGLPSWSDRVELLPGQDFEKEIEKAISNARAVVVVWSAAAVESDWVRAEASEGMKQKKLVPVRIDECQPPLSFRHIQTLPLGAWRDDLDHDDFRKLLSGIKSIMTLHDVSSPATSSRHTSGANKAKGGSLWTVEAVAFRWSGASFMLVHGGVRHVVEYRNHLQYEALYLNGVEKLRGGSETSIHPAFQFYIDGEGDPATCMVEPVYGLFSKLVSGRLSKLKVSVDGRLLSELTT